MALVLPKIVYPTGGGTTLSFVYPPRFKPGNIYEATRFDNEASSGVMEIISVKLVTFFEFTMEFVKDDGSDLAAWDSFMQSALTGTAFDYYPDATVNSFTTYTLVDTNWTPAYKQLAMKTFKLKFRKRVGWP